MTKYVYANLKRFDIPKQADGLNSIAPSPLWGEYIVKNIQEDIKEFAGGLECAIFLPEAHIINAVKNKTEKSMLKVGCQGVFRKDTEKGKNFGAFTTNRTAKSMLAIGCESTIIGHCEERADKLEIMAEAGTKDSRAVNRLLNEEIKCAIKAGLTVLYCIGEKEEEQDRWEEVISEQLQMGLEGVDTAFVRIAYEPVWAIGPGKPVPDSDYIRKVAALSKRLYPEVPVLYGGGLKYDNADMLASIDEIDGGLVGLTRFSGDIGFYPEEFIDIIRRYMESCKTALRLQDSLI